MDDPSAAEFPAMPLYWKDWLTGDATSRMSAEQEGVFLRLLLHAWMARPRCTLLNDDRVLASLARVSSSRWRTISPLILEQFELVEGRLRNPKQWAVFLELLDLREAKIAAGKLGAARRWKGGEHDGTANGTANGTPNGRRHGKTMADGMANAWPASASASASKESPCVPLLKKGEDTPRVALPRRKEPLPANWAPNGAHRTLAASLSLDVAAELEQFRDHAASTGRRLVSWDAAFRMWLRRGAELHRNGKHAPTPADDDGELSPNGDFRWSEKAGRWLKR